MRPIPKKLLKEILKDPFYQTCIRHKEKKCGGRITFEHAIIYAGKQVNEKWCILPVCERHHGVNSYQDRGDMDKKYHEWVAVNRMTIDDEKTYCRVDWKIKRKYLNSIYGNYNPTKSVQHQ